MAKESAFAKALVSIDWSLDAPPPIIRCPVTGSVVCAGYDPETGETPDDYVEPEWEQIPTMLFHFYDELDEFSFIAPKLEAAIAQKRQELGDEAEDMHDMEILTEHLESLGSVPLVFCITLGGMACGPVSSSTYVGLDLAAAYQK